MPTQGLTKINNQNTTHTPISVDEFDGDEGRTRLETLASRAINQFFRFENEPQRSEANSARAETLVRQLIGLNFSYALVTDRGRVKVACIGEWLESQTSLDAADATGSSLPQMLAKQDFETREAPRKGVAAPNGKLLTLPLPKLWLEWPDRREYRDGYVFDPGGPRDLKRTSLNIWQGWGYENYRGDGKVDDPIETDALKYFLTHVRESHGFADDDEERWFWAWWAHMLQHPKQKPGTGIIVQGGKGCGKTIVADTLRMVVGKCSFKTAKEAEVTGNFSGHMENRVLFVAEEAVWGGSAQADSVMKDMMTSPIISIRRMHTDAYEAPNYVHFYMMTNKELPAKLDMGSSERRWFVLRCNDQFTGNTEHFNLVAAHRDHGTLIWDLGRWLMQPERLEGVNLRQPPRTAAAQTVAESGLSVAESYFFGALKEGDNWPEDAVHRDSEGERYIFRGAVYEPWKDYCIEHGDRRSPADTALFNRLITTYFGARHGGQKRNGPVKQGGKTETFYYLPTRRRAQADYAEAKGKLDMFKGFDAERSEEDYQDIGLSLADLVGEAVAAEPAAD